jgi:hypothetical protein
MPHPVDTQCKSQISARSPSCNVVIGNGRMINKEKSNDRSDHSGNRVGKAKKGTKKSEVETASMRR